MRLPDFRRWWGVVLHWIARAIFDDNSMARERATVRDNSRAEERAKSDDHSSADERASPSDNSNGEERATTTDNSTVAERTTTPIIETDTPIDETPPPVPTPAQPRASQPRARAPRQARPRPAPTPKPATPEDESAQSTPPRESRAVRRARGETRHAPKPRKPADPEAMTSLAALLDNVEAAFDNLTQPISRAEIPHDSVIGYRRLGPHVIDVPADTLSEEQWNEYLNGKPVQLIERPRKWSAMMFIAFQDLREQITEKWSVRQFFYATRLKKTPCIVEHGNGIVYEAGIGWRAKEDIYWSTFYCVINPDDLTVHALQMRLLNNVQVEPSHGGGLSKRTSYKHRDWGIPQTYYQDHWHKEMGPRRHLLEVVFAQGFHAWQERAKSWSVALKRNGYRATICVKPQNTSVFFRDRKREALTSNGRLRPVMHFVEEHERIMPSGNVVTVKPHIRGLRAFNWRGYHCDITSPRFHQLVSQDFDAAADEHHTDPPKSDKFLSASWLGNWIATAEDTQDLSDVKPASKLREQQRARE